MRAIIIEDKDARDLLRRLEMEKLRDAGHFRGQEVITTAQMHRVFHYQVTRWLQEQGCDCIDR
jgi:hypothetical protein